MWVNEEARASQEETIHASNRMLFRSWETLRGQRSAPARQDLDLKQLRKLLPGLFIAEHVNQGQDYRWRLAGTGICSLLGREVTGASLLDGWDEFEAGVIRRFLSTVTASHQPALLRIRFTTDKGQQITAEMAVFPLLAADGASTHVLGGFFTFPDPQLKHFDTLTARELVSARFAASEALASLPGEPLAQAPRKFRVITGGLDKP